jgi:DNA-binding transcriptional LysR family regulator
VRAWAAPTASTTMLSRLAPEPADPTPVLIRRDRLREFWPAIRPLLDKVRDKTGEGWLPEDIFAAAMAGKAGVYVAKSADGTHISGVAVIEKETAWGVDTLHLWACYHKDKDRGVAAFWPWLVHQARAWGCRRVTLQSPRRMDRVLPVRPLSTTYVCEV